MLPNVSFELAAAGDGTEITWRMQGNLPWFMFWMRSSMETFIGMDYERGLKMLKEFIETGTVLSQTDVIGVESIEVMNVLGVGDFCSTDDVGPTMTKAFATATEQLSRNAIAIDGDMLSVYHPCDLKLRRFDFTSGYAVPSGSQAPAGLNHCQLPAGKSLHIRHTGRYENLGNAWSGGYQYARYRKLKVAKRDAFEIYRNKPEENPPAELVTDIFLPLR
ncbi:MAG: GyrI-like domain-containing protein [Fuerstiella sp.]